MNAVSDVPHLQIPVTRGQALAWQLRVLAPEWIRLTARVEIGAVTLPVEPLRWDFISGDKLLVNDNQIVTLSGPASAGAISVSVVALTAPIFSNRLLQKIRNITGYTVMVEILREPNDIPSLLQMNGSITSGPNGLVDFVANAAATLALPANEGALYVAGWRTDVGQERPLFEGDIIVKERGNLA